MKTFMKALLKDTATSAACTIGTFGGIVLVGEMISKIEEIKKSRSKKEEPESEEDEA